MDMFYRPRRLRQNKLIRELVAETTLNSNRLIQPYFVCEGENIKEEIVGIIAGMLYGSPLIEQNKPIIAFAQQSEELIKVSARATDNLVRQGLNLGKILKEICFELGKNAEGGESPLAPRARQARAYSRRHDQ